MRTIVGAWMVLVLLAGCATSTAPRAANGPARQSAASAPADDNLPYDVGAVVTNIVYIPGKVILCGVGTVFGGSILALTFGSGYGGAASFVQEGCGGKWVVTGDDIRRETSKRYWGPGQ
jgi:hypothetical protein